MITNTKYVIDASVWERTNQSLIFTMTYIKLNWIKLKPWFKEKSCLNKKMMMMNLRGKNSYKVSKILMIKQRMKQKS